MLAAYNQIFPGCAERILAMAESQSAHRQELERAVVLGNVAHAKRGQDRAFILGLAGVLCGAGLIAFGRPVEGLVSIIGALAALAGVFVYGRSREEKERQRKKDELTATTPN
ncbi:MAG: DUF2335 domain-containing protein [Phycisphaerales bacterium]|nr:DUF2335 domain-containing protein [Phycisphaerales bacterium]